MSLLVVAGEASGDRAAAAVIRRLPGVEAFGMGGAALAREGMPLTCDLRDVTALGVGEVARRAIAVGAAYTRLRAEIVRRRPSVALLVNYTEFNTELSRVLWKSGTRVLWYGAPQIWAWREGRASSLRRTVDRMAVILPFEEALWRRAGVDARYVGHPALEDLAPGMINREVARRELDLTARAAAVAILPGSRPHEVRRLLPTMIAGFDAVRSDRASIDARILLASSLDGRTHDWACECARAADIRTFEVDARAGTAPLLPAFEASIVASGTASLECALARAVPVIAYRVGWATELAARAFLQTRWVGLPNVLLGRGAFPELLQDRLSPGSIARALEDVLDRRDEHLAACAEVEAELGAATSPSREVVRMLDPWLARERRVS